MWERKESPGSFDAGGCIIDHIIPWVQSRDDSLRNLQALCPACSAAKTKLDNDDTRAMKSDVIHYHAVQEAKAKLALVQQEYILKIAEAERILADTRSKGAAIILAAQRELDEAEAKMASVGVVVPPPSWPHSPTSLPSPATSWPVPTSARRSVCQILPTICRV
jgi:hypothetical protein